MFLAGCVVDADGDGFVDNDCDDAAAEVHPGAIERWNTVDDDCDGARDHRLGSSAASATLDISRDQLPEERWLATPLTGIGVNGSPGTLLASASEWMAVSADDWLPVAAGPTWFDGIPSYSWRPMAHVAADDLDGDGLTDAVLTGLWRGQTYAGWWNSDGMERLAIELPPYHEVVTARDLTGDGHPEVVTTDPYGESSIFVFDGRTLFDEPVLLSQLHGYAAVGRDLRRLPGPLDWNGDGATELLVRQDDRLFAWTPTRPTLEPHELHLPTDDGQRCEFALPATANDPPSLPRARVCELPSGGTRAEFLSWEADRAEVIASWEDPSFPPLTDAQWLQEDQLLVHGKSWHTYDAASVLLDTAGGLTRVADWDTLPHGGSGVRLAAGVVWPIGDVDGDDQTDVARWWSEGHDAGTWVYASGG